MTNSGSIFLQIGDENFDKIKLLLDEIFGTENFTSVVFLTKTSGFGDTRTLGSVGDFILWYAKRKEVVKYRQLYLEKNESSDLAKDYKYFFNSLSGLSVKRNDLEKHPDKEFIQLATYSSTTSQGETLSGSFSVDHLGKCFDCPSGQHWKTNKTGFSNLLKASRIYQRTNSLRYARFLDDYKIAPINNLWSDLRWGFDASLKSYVVETNPQIVARCLLMATDPGDLVLDPTCGSGTTAYVAEQWGRRWIAIDTSRVALALARARIMGARYPYYLLKDSKSGQQKEAELTRTIPSESPTYGNIRQGFVYDRVPHITLKAIANNAEIDVIWEQYQPQVEEALTNLNAALDGHSKPYKVTTGSRNGQKIDFTASGTVKLPSGEDAPANALLEWEVPREQPTDWPDNTQKPLAEFWKARIARQKEIDASIAASADQEFLYDKPYQDKTIVRVAGPFTVESLSPHRVLAVDEHDELVDQVDSGKCLVTSQDPSLTTSAATDFANVILETLKIAGVQQAHKSDKITFTTLTGWPGDYICAEGRYLEGDSETEKRAGIFIGPEFGTVSRADLVAATREAGDAGFDVLIACAFSYDAHSAEFTKLGRIPVLKARMNADLHMADTLKNTGKGNLFVIFGEPDIVVASEEWIVDSAGTRVAPYEIFKLVSGVDRLAEINELSRQDLCRYAEFSCRREIWDHLTDTASRHVNSSQYRGGSGQENDRGVSTVAWHCAGISGGTGNLHNFVREAGLSHPDKFRELTQRLYRDWQNAAGTHEISLHSPLTTSHYTQVTIHGVDVFHPQSGEVRASDTDAIACWFIDTDYNEESFFVRHAYFLGASDPYKSLKTTLNVEIDPEAWESLYSETSRPFDKPKSGRIAVKVINHLGDEVMKVFSVS